MRWGASLAGAAAAVGSALVGLRGEWRPCKRRMREVQEEKRELREANHDLAREARVAAAKASRSLRDVTLVLRTADDVGGLFRQGRHGRDRRRGDPL